MTADDHSNEALIAAMLAWWNRAFANGAMTPGGFAEFFTQDAAFIVNGEVRGRGPAALAAFFGGQRHVVEAAVMQLPLIKGFSAGDHVFFDYDMHIGPPATPEIRNAKGYARIEDGRIAHYTVNSFVR
ncbi:nuclear transport factor 2 family protein [Sphingomonas colocasiae]|uniref:Nuclear transport factor 2 family protein n=1 Tax=Sphingomonas colocasiae TaxID=1848973 RepID=A0ABS7Q0C3_9SPHN|nr:nuclear transport factor 2 family protein [Sphingomonas colocasiae]MBY8826335.1 nuclear transport factor 2 family protein [Sphingomonas colocasiae]